LRKKKGDSRGTSTVLIHLISIFPRRGGGGSLLRGGAAPLPRKPFEKKKKRQTPDESQEKGREMDCRKKKKVPSPSKEGA